jgi:hypothetical protein
LDCIAAGFGTHRDLEKVVTSLRLVLAPNLLDQRAMLAFTLSEQFLLLLD